MSWNYRVATYMFSYKKTFSKDNQLSKREDERLFKICSAYYDKDGKLESYGEGSKTDSLDGYESAEDLKKTIDLIQKASAKPIIDLDNFPNEWNK